MSSLGTLTILVLDDEPNVRRAIARLDLGAAMRIVPVGTIAEADAVVAGGEIDVALVDQHLGPGGQTGLDWLSALRLRDPDCFRIIFTGAADLDFAVHAINGGLIDAFLTKPWSEEQAVALLLQGAEACLLRRHNRALLDELSHRNGDLLAISTNLEQLVAERTASLREANERLRQQQQALVQLETQGVLNHLAKGLAHELNNPLAVILGYTQRLARAGGEPDTIRRLNVILQEVDRCRALVDQLRRIAAPLDEETVPLAPAEVLAEAVRRRTDSGLATPVIGVPAAVPAVIAARGALRRVFTEVLDNAVAAGARTVVLSGREDYGRAFLRLANDGVRPTYDEATNATKPFFTTRAGDGARGLGLAIAAGLLRDQDGHLELEVGEIGAVVQIQLPAAGPIPVDPLPQSAPIPTPHPVLVVDDDVLIGELLADVLQDLGLVARVVGTCAEARAAIAAGRFSAVLSDVNLPDGSGELLLTELVTRYRLTGRVALITGDVHNSRLFPTLPKPFRIDQVQDLVLRLLQV